MMLTLRECLQMKVFGKRLTQKQLHVGLKSQSRSVSIEYDRHFPSVGAGNSTLESPIIFSPFIRIFWKRCMVRRNFFCLKTFQLKSFFGMIV